MGSEWPFCFAFYCWLFDAWIFFCRVGLFVVEGKGGRMDGRYRLGVWNIVCIRCG
jgi:hypothetical protein